MTVHPRTTTQMPTHCSVSCAQAQVLCPPSFESWESQFTSSASTRTLHSSSAGHALAILPTSTIRTPLAVASSISSTRTWPQNVSQSGSSASADAAPLTTTFSSAERPAERREAQAMLAQGRERHAADEDEPLQGRRGTEHVVERVDAAGSRRGARRVLGVLPPDQHVSFVANLHLGDRARSTIRSSPLLRSLTEHESVLTDFLYGS
ncbi:hypothetical protein F5148DRAFT_1373486 [Russula earlei]|uniref:Uncharacterized protein n=1 Tax=Russula earlei TaxID=71964 RepID=A0ACC0UJZ6_9AGAM|nr:hypothetical protein F5148DRAFT_1373486 [Russula earlei]